MFCHNAVNLNSHALQFFFACVIVCMVPRMSFNSHMFSLKVSEMIL